MGVGEGVEEMSEKRDMGGQGIVKNDWKDSRDTWRLGK